FCARSYGSSPFDF
nr:immunoglobulin heavy chain junction region [Mus musculus]